MAFQIKDFRSIVASLINVSKASQSKITDFGVGSVARTLMESPAIEIEELYLQMALGLQDAIPVAIYQAFDFPLIDGESDLLRKSRFIQFVFSISRATVRSVKYAAALASVGTETVARVGFEEMPGLVVLYLWGSNGAPSTELLAQAQRVIDGYETELGEKVNGYRAAGVEVRVLAMVQRAVPITVSVLPMAGVPTTDALEAAVIAAVGEAVRSVAPGGLLRSASVVAKVLTVNGVMSCAAETPSNTVCHASEMLIPGAITVEWLANA